MDKDWKLIEQSINTSLIHFLKEKLASNGIEAIVLNQQDSMYKIGLGSAELYVKTKDVIRAKHILNKTEDE